MEADTERKITDLGDIERTPEGQLLIAALVILTTEEPRRDKTPWEVIAELNKISNQTKS